MKKTTSIVKYTLISTEWVYTPGLVRWVIEGMGRSKAKKFFATAFPTLPNRALHRLVRGEYEVRGDKVIIAVPHSATRKCLGPCERCRTIPLGKS